MTQSSYYWAGLVTGDAALAPYSASVWTSIWRKMYQMDRTTQAVIPGYSSEMIVTNPAGSTVRVAAGAALVDGVFYENSANIDFSVSTPVSLYYYYRIVLRKNPTSQTVRLALVGPSSVDYPVVTQIDGGIWEVSIARILVSSAGVVTVYEGRRFCASPLSAKSKVMEIVLASTSTLVQLGEIPQVYKHLQLVVSGMDTTAGPAGVYGYLNGDGGANYDNLKLWMWGDNTHTTTPTVGASDLYLGYWSSTNNNRKEALEVDFIDYRSSKYKTIFSRCGYVGLAADPTTWNFIAINQWNSNSAINKIELYGNAGFSSGTMFTLYGWN